MTDRKIAAIFCGDRFWEDREKIKQKMEDLSPDEVIEGGARGADLLSWSIAKELGISVAEVPAEWEKLGRAAGPVRNKAMLDRLRAWEEKGYEIKVVAFHSNIEKSKGTANMVKLARTAGVSVEIIV